MKGAKALCEELEDKGKSDALMSCERMQFCCLLIRSASAHVVIIIIIVSKEIALHPDELLCDFDGYM